MRLIFHSATRDETTRQHFPSSSAWAREALPSACSAAVDEANALGSNDRDKCYYKGRRGRCCVANASGGRGGTQFLHCCSVSRLP
jgi:hypothetical protein